MESGVNSGFSEPYQKLPSDGRFLFIPMLRSAGRIRTCNLLVTLSPKITFRSGLYHHPVYSHKKGRGASADKIYYRTTPLTG